MTIDISTPPRWVESVARPCRRTYRARKSPEVEILNEWDDPEVLVKRTHDVDVAVALAAQPWAGLWSPDPLPVPKLIWFHEVPWGNDGCDRMIERVGPADRRATPGVLFR